VYLQKMEVKRDEEDNTYLQKIERKRVMRERKKIRRTCGGGSERKKVILNKKVKVKSNILMI
jgi:hypothetical protein